jgi:hypothetical protein
MSNTLRTDALASTPMTRKDSDDFCRQLERENGKLVEVLAESRHLLKELVPSFHQNKIHDFMEESGELLIAHRASQEKGKA